MQIAVIEFARSIMKLHGANSTEFDPTTKTPCVIFMPEVIILLQLQIAKCDATVNSWINNDKLQKPICNILIFIFRIP
jgi:CTP synthase (UTP-ammonia lyase)